MRKRTYSEIASDAFFEMCGFIGAILHPEYEFIEDDETDSEKLKRIEKALEFYKNKVKEEREQLED